jgi:hypothetical protein
MEALHERSSDRPVALMWLVALGLFNSVVSAFYYVRVLKAMFLRSPSGKRLGPATRPVSVPIVIATVVVVVFGIMPDSLMSMMQAAAIPMLTAPGPVAAIGLPSAGGQPTATPRPPRPAVKFQYSPAQMKGMRSTSQGGGGPAGKGAFPKGAAGKAAGKGASAKSKTKGAPPKGESAKAGPGRTPEKSAPPPAAKIN